EPAIDCVCPDEVFGHSPCTGRKPILVRLGTKVPMVIANCTMEEYSTAQPIFFIGEHPESQLFETGHQKAPSVDGIVLKLPVSANRQLMAPVSDAIPQIHGIHILIELPFEIPRHLQCVWVKRWHIATTAGVVELLTEIPLESKFHDELMQSRDKRTATDSLEVVYVLPWQKYIPIRAVL